MTAWSGSSPLVTCTAPAPYPTPILVSSKTSATYAPFSWRRVVRWLRGKHPRLNWKQLRRRYLSGGWPTAGEVTLFNPSAVSTVRIPLPGNTIPSPWPSRRRDRRIEPATRSCGEPDARDGHVRFGGGPGKRASRKAETAPGPTQQPDPGAQPLLPVLPMMRAPPNDAATTTYAHGTTSLFAALDMASARLIGSRTDVHRAAEFKKFLIRIDKKCRRSRCSFDS